MYTREIQSSCKIRHKNPVRLEHTDSSGLNLSGYDVRTSDFTGALVAGGRFDRSVVSGSRFDHSGMEFVSMSLARADWCSFHRAQMPQFRGVGSSFRRSCFIEANAPFSSFKGSVLDRAQFVGANLQNCDLTGARFLHTDFSYADLRGARIDMRRALEEGAIFSDTLLDEHLAAHAAGCRRRKFYRFSVQYS
jgi:uncharacterized protein YjbI with pentapeptide repeats